MDFNRIIGDCLRRHAAENVGERDESKPLIHWKNAVAKEQSRLANEVAEHLAELVCCHVEETKAGVAGDDVRGPAGLGDGED